MKDNLELKVFRKSYLLMVVLFVTAMWCVAWVCCDYSRIKACLISAVFALFAGCAYFLIIQRWRKFFGDVEKLSKLMVDVVDGKINYEEEVYKQGELGILYTNFYKMVTILRESQMKEGKEKEFLKDTISDISHQLKTPLASLTVFVDLLYEDKITDEKKKKEVLDEARKQLQRMEWMVLAMLKLARIEAGAVQFERRSYSVKQILNASIEGVGYLLEKRKQTAVIVWEEENTDVVMECDGEWLTEAIINLLKNASDYSHTESNITIHVEENQLFTRISIEDEGMGIGEEALPHIFKRFYRADNAVNPGSVGIGLALTKSIVEGMGGRIKVKSQVGKYTCFILTFMK